MPSVTHRTLHRPTPIRTHDASPVDHSTSPQVAAQRLLAGEKLLVTDHYGTGVAILEALAAQIGRPAGTAGFEERQAFERRFRTAALRLLAPIRDHWLALKDAGAMDFLVELYPEMKQFFLPLIEVQELHGAWLRYRDGVKLAVLGHALHPFYGTYAPRRTEHLELFATWLSQYDGAKGQAIDVGTGCGVLAFLLAKKFDRVLATDSNPNAIESVERELKRLDPPPRIDLFCGDLLGDDPTPADLVVFNPPWTQGTPVSLLDEALLFEDATLFERFFAQARERLAADGRIVVVFSNILTLVQPDVPHPIEAELERGHLKLVQKMRRKVKSEPGSRRRTKERVEIWELAKA